MSNKNNRACKPSYLFLLCINRKWNEVLKYLKDAPEEAGKLLSTGKRGSANVSAILVVLSHAKCQGSVPLEIVDVLLKLAPEFANTCHVYTGKYLFII